MGEEELEFHVNVVGTNRSENKGLVRINVDWLW